MASKESSQTPSEGENDFIIDIVTFKGIKFLSNECADDPAKIENMKLPRRLHVFVLRFPNDETRCEVATNIQNAYPWRHVPAKSAREKKCKIIYVSRNIKDVVVSAYFMFKDMKMRVVASGVEGVTGMENVHAWTMRQYMERMAGDQVVFGNYFEHNLEYWEQRNSGHVLFLFYEDLVEDLAGGVRRIADFLDKQLSDEQVATIVNETGFDRMRTNPLTNWEFLTETGLRDAAAPPLVRKGKVGDWRNHFDDEMSDFADALCRKHFEPVNLKHRFE
ncbi:PREDICTED: estrogen sulfotransferase, isoform 1-like [Priapulus caudatus]|uniref:Estrogen sulfotransferase, isoform 1-like n=1 Tax=Priapulus caudatus TaxID=37621 RepID=A0ABM1EQW9_PRICU|nr:PREDICTED: estrogen sulfotransferase, isoform 1-like [Priapulus caudatus]